MVNDITYLLSLKSNPMLQIVSWWTRGITWHFRLRYIFVTESSTAVVNVRYQVMKSRHQCVAYLTTSWPLTNIISRMPRYVLWNENKIKIYIRNNSLKFITMVQKSLTVNFAMTSVGYQPGHQALLHAWLFGIDCRKLHEACTGRFYHLLDISNRIYTLFCFDLL